jgi:hypothetical protein
MMRPCYWKQFSEASPIQNFAAVVVALKVSDAGIVISCYTREALLKGKAQYDWPPYIN